MKAVWYEATGPAVEVLSWGDMPDPEPGSGDVRVKVAYSGVNPSDVKRRGGTNGQGMPFPRVVPGMDGSGVIDRVGPGVDPARVGQRVWLHSTAWKRPFGTCADYAITSSERAFELPANTSMLEGASLGVPAMTAHRAVFGLGPVDGKTVVVTGGAGGVGFYAIQLAKWGGAKVIATVSSEEKAQVARRAGADEVVNYKTEDVAKRALAITGGAGVDHVVDVDFGANLPATVAMTKLGASIATYSSMSQPQPSIPFYPMMNKNLQVLWVLVYDMPAAAIADAGRDVNRWLVSGKAQHQIAKTIPLERLAEAHLAVESGREIGKVAVRVGGDL
ncbi:NADPH:quinone reductase [Ramlibacter sp.]|uniref:NADPH:quinone reductase n=1 Tax=Ramlibacter sp. TaxID=1917967 RepID=UPI003D0D94DC